MPMKETEAEIILKWKKERKKLNEMAEQRIKKNLPINDEEILRQNDIVCELAEQVMEIRRKQVATSNFMGE